MSTILIGPSCLPTAKLLTNLGIMHVLLQRPSPMSRPFGFSQTLCEVKVRSLSQGSPWKVLDSIKVIEANSSRKGLPILHRGYYDSHLHATWMGSMDNDIDFRQCNDVGEFLRLCRKKSEEAQANGVKILKGFGWDESRFNVGGLEDFISRVENELPDQVALLLYRICSHSALVNRSFKEQYGEASWPTFITDRLILEIDDRLPEWTVDNCRNYFLASQKRLISAGYSAISEMSSTDRMVDAFQMMTERSELLLDVVAVLHADEAKKRLALGPTVFKNQSALGPMDRKAVCSCLHWKRFLDGSFGARTAWLKDFYSDAELLGEQLFPTEQLIEESRRALENGFHLSYHAIGDAALEQLLELGSVLGPKMKELNESQNGFPVKAAHRIEHFQLADDDQIKRLADQGLWTVCAQPHHRIADAGFIKQRLGEKRLYHNAYRAASILKKGVGFSLGSDAPIDSFDPIKVLTATIQHENPEESLGFEEAVWVFTTGARLQQGLHPGVIKAGSTVMITPYFDS